mgnify:CR=1 FL=1
MSANMIDWRSMENIGICFQIKDDLFDYYSNDVGKPTGSDMREGKITLPALYVLENSNNPVLEPIRAKLTASQFLDENEIGQLIRISIEEYTNLTVLNA